MHAAFVEYAGPHSVPAFYVHLKITECHLKITYKKKSGKSVIHFYLTLFLLGGEIKMEQIKKGKLDRPHFWATILILWGLMAAVMLVGVDIQRHETLSVTRIIILLILEVFYFVAMIMRLEDAGRSKALVLVCFIFPIFMFIIGAFPSESVDDEAVKKEKLKAEKAGAKQSQQHGRF